MAARRNRGSKAAYRDDQDPWEFFGVMGLIFAGLCFLTYLLINPGSGVFILFLMVLGISVKHFYASN